MKKLQIDEKVKMTDEQNTLTPIGIVRLYDSNGKLIQEKHNMVVLSGRKLLASLFYKAITGNVLTNGVSITSDSNLKLLMTWDNTNSATLYTSTFSYNSSSNNYAADVAMTNDHIKPTYPTSNNSNEIKFTFSANISNTNDAQKKINTIMLMYNNGTGLDNTWTLFSRVLIDPVYLGNGDSYSLEYSLYF